MRVSCRPYTIDQERIHERMKVLLKEAVNIAMNDSLEIPRADEFVHISEPAYDGQLSIIDSFICDWSLSTSEKQHLIVLVNYCFLLFDNGELKFDEFLRLLTLPCRGVIPRCLAIKRLRNEDNTNLLKLLIHFLIDMYDTLSLCRMRIQEDDYNYFVSYYNEDEDGIDITLDKSTDDIRASEDSKFSIIE